MSDVGAGFVFGLVIGACLITVGFMLILTGKITQCEGTAKQECHIMAVVKEAK